MPPRTPAKFTDYVRPACLPEKNEEVPAGKQCIAHGSHSITKILSKYICLKLIKIIYEWHYYMQWGRIYQQMEREHIPLKNRGSVAKTEVVWPGMLVQNQRS